MILERKMKIDMPDFNNQIDENNIAINQLFESKDFMLDLNSLMQTYNSAMKEISTKLEILDDDFHTHHMHNPIHHLECRIKGVKSIITKTLKNSEEVNIDTIKENVLDIAGIRVICNYTDDIYLVEKLLLQQTDVSLVKRKDYIKEPKESGYRSLHIVVSIPVFLIDQTLNIPVEIQMRTIAMDYWASLEHQLQYKNENTNFKAHQQKLQECAMILSQTEKDMQEIYKSIYSRNNKINNL